MKEHNMSDLFDAVIAAGNDVERPAFRQAPPGEYLVKVRSAKNRTSSKGTRGIEVDYTLLEVMHTDGDMDGVDLKRCRLSQTFWVSEASYDIARQQIVRLNPEAREFLTTNPMSQVHEILPGSEAVVRVIHDTVDAEGNERKIPRLEVKAIYSLDWYNQNKRAA